jgi:2,3-bisphosphoglycerate-dependent phosphoglycerate mutase
MQLYYIRHAQSENNALWAHTGSSDGRSCDPPLTPIGQEQAYRLADFLCRGSQAQRSGAGRVLPGTDPKNLAGFEITHLYCSLMLRSVETGAILAEALGLPLVGWIDLHESGGIYLEDEATGELVGLPGRSRSYFEAHYPDLVLPQAVGQEGWWNRPFEAREERLPRAQRAYRELLERHGGTDDRVAWVSHGGFYNHFLAAVLDLPGQRNYAFDMNNGAITRLDFGDEMIRLRYMNRTDYLPGELIT